ncbi:uncharacterized protein LOC108147157 [Drosophila elegans]|uniref:uncharacterized protein LOC108147157 n=1 Tax=Drosophila elegans TaxID=30023 RepID=UPI0007E89B08|nr:uncharacterized protein LOC108147157 [Drosophila elegans]
MYANLFWSGLIACLVLARSGLCFEAKRFFGVGERINGDQLLVKDVLHSRPAGVDELPRVTFTYEIQEPITCVEIVSEENISAEVKFSLVNRLVVGMVQLAGTNQSDDPTREVATVPPTVNFDVIIMVYGLNETALNFDQSLIINRDQQYEGEMQPYEEIFSEPDQYVEVFDNNRRDALEVDEEIENLSEEDDEDDEDDETFTEVPTLPDNFDKPDKIIEVGNRQDGDQLLYESYQTSPDVSQKPTNNSVVFYYIDNNSITYVKFVILDHHADRNISDADYIAPVAEYSHFSRGTLKAVVTDFHSLSIFVQMYIYGFRGRVTPANYVPFLPPPDWQRNLDLETRTPGLEKKTPHLTPLQTMQLLLLTGQRTTPPPGAFNDSGEEHEEQRSIRPEEMVFEQIEDEQNSALRQMDRGLGALLGLLLLILHN